MDNINLDDVILFLLPHKGEGFEGAAFATSMPENKSRFVRARQNIPRPRSIPRHEREETVLPTEYGLLDNTDCLVVKFSHGARTSVGAVGGCAGNADLTFQNIPGVSKFHLAFTFDDKTNIPIARDLASTGGTKVIYNGESGERLSNFDWPLIGPSIAKGRYPILNITDLIQFKVIVPHRDFTSPDYIEKVNKFRVGTADPEDLFASLILRSVHGTQLPTGQQTPSKGAHSPPIFYKESLGEGAFGVVTYVWNVTTREEYVVKSPLQKLIDSGGVNYKSWMEEADIMRSISHEHIVTFRDATFHPYPHLEFEYIPGGSLEKYTDVSVLESAQILYQLSSALEYLHNQTPSIGHRDIKPENILVVERAANGILVKFGDFGLSKAADTLKTCCGTARFAAPEIYLKMADAKGAADKTYSVAVDIWSLGVVVASLVCGGLPVYKDEWTTDAFAWIRAIENHVMEMYNMQGGELLWLLNDSMLVEDPDERSSADYIHDEALKILQSMASNESDNDNDGDEGSTTPKALMLTAQPAAWSEDVEEESTFRLDSQPALDGSTMSIRDTVESLDESLIADCGNANPTDSEEREQLDVPSPDTQLSLNPERSRPLSLGSTVNGLLWNREGPKRPSLTSNHDNEAGGLNTIDIFSLIRYELGGAVGGDGSSAVDAHGGKEPIRKRTWAENTHPLSSVQQRLTISTGSSAYKRSKRER